MSRPPDLGTRGDGRFRVVDAARIVDCLVRNLWPYEAAADPERATADAAALLERWIVEGLPFSVVDGERRFDPCEACNFPLAAWLRDGDPVFLTRQVASSRRMVREMQARITAATRFALTFRREFNLHGIAAGTPVRLRLPVPVDGDSAAALRSTHDAAVPDAIELRSPGRLELRFAMPRPAQPSLAIEVTADLAGTASGTPLAADAPDAPYDTGSEEYRLHTRPREGLIRVTPAVVELAAALAGPRARPARIVRSIWDHFVKRMHVGFIHYDELDPGDPLAAVIARGWCDCHTGSALFAALARARGIPARIVTGAVLYPVAPSQHSWLEVLLPPLGWLPVDIFGAFLAARRQDDTEWSGRFLGHLDPRLTTQRLPVTFTGAVGVAVPDAWYILQRLAKRRDGGGTELTLGCLDERAWLLRDTIRVAACTGPADPAGGGA